MLRVLQSGACLGFLALAGCAQQASLRQDAEGAEDRAIRYADAHNGLRSGRFESMAEYGRARDQLIEEMFKTVAAQHGVSVEQVRQSLAYRPAGVDVLVMLSFGALYAGIAYLILRRLNSNVMTSYLSIVWPGIAVLLGEAWAILIEQLRLGTGHLSYRMDRIPWGHHRLALFVAGVVLFWIVALLRRKGPTPVSA
jgi:hypothetical protein